MKKRGLSLFLALALCLTLLPAAAFADSESETSTPHTHYLCGNGETCSHLGGHNEDSKTTFATAITQNNDGYVWGGGDCTQNQPNQCVLSNGGTYYPASDLVLEAPLNAQFGCIQIDGNVTLCLNGHTITVKANREAFKITKYGSTSSSTLTLTDCQGGGKITHDPSFLGNSVNLSEDCNFIMYGGSITGNSVASSGGGVCVYGAMTVSGSVRITRLAFQLFTDSTPTAIEYDKDDNPQYSFKECQLYSVSDTFCCSYAPFFVEAVKLRYPDYFSPRKVYRQ